MQGARVGGVGTVTRENLKRELDSIVGEGKYELSEGENSWTVKVGDYRATVSKNGNVEKEVVTNYTAEEIEANEHLYAIGRTVSTYVVAEFNEDYTEVTITKNGEESDGKIAEFAPWKASPMSTHKSTLKTAIIKNGVTNTGSGSAGGGMFSGCTELINVQIPNSIIYIGSNTFIDCTGLTNIIIPNSVTSIYNMAFRGCTSLTSIEIPNSVILIDSNAFYDCTSLTSIKIPNNVTSIGSYAFYDCTSLTSIEISNGVIRIGGEAFYGTGYYNESSNWENEVLYIGQYLLEAKDTLSGNYIIKDGTKNIADNAFYGCTSLTNIEIPNTVTSIGYVAFRECTGLTSIEIPNSITSIGDDAFNNTGYYNESSNWENDLLYIGQYLLSAKETLSGKCIIKEGTKYIAAYAFGGCTSLTSIEIPNSVTVIGEYAFQYCPGLTSIEIPNSVTNIGSQAFGRCTGLTIIQIPSSVKKVDECAFVDLAAGSTIYCETQEVADLLVPDPNYNYNYTAANTTVVVDASKFE